MSTLSRFIGKNFENAVYGTGQLDFSKNQNVLVFPENSTAVNIFVNNFPAYSGFDRKVITFTYIKFQPASGGTLAIPGSFRVTSGGTPSNPGATTRIFQNSDIVWLSGSIPTPVPSTTQILTYTLVNTNFTNPNGATIDDYTLIGSDSASAGNAGITKIVNVPSSDSFEPTANDNNTLYILEGPTSILNLANVTTPPIGTRFGIISKNSSNIIIRPIGFSIQGLDEDLVLDRDYSSLDIVYTGSSFGWAIK